MKNKKIKVLGVIPARFQSTRFPGKPLAKIFGKSMIWYVYKNCKKAKLIDKVIVATDNKQIYNEVLKFGGEVIYTSAKHKSGTDRVAEVGRKFKPKIIVNIQGDEPLINPKLIDAVVYPILNEKEIYFSSAVNKTNYDDLVNPNLVKVVKDKNNFALYFSRSIIPFVRDKEILNKVKDNFFTHIGIYAYTNDFLQIFTKLKETFLERLECLEQLRAIENGYKLYLVETKYKSLAVDTPEDLQKVIVQMKHDKKI